MDGGDGTERHVPLCPTINHSCKARQRNTSLTLQTNFPFHYGFVRQVRASQRRAKQANEVRTGLERQGRDTVTGTPLKYLTHKKQLLDHSTV